jgi:hypothetical protein
MSRRRGSELTERLAMRVTAAEKTKISAFCLKNNLTQKKFVLMAIDRYIAA